MATSIINKGRLPYFYDAYKRTTVSADTVTLKNTTNIDRYVALLFIVQNYGNSGIYAINYKRTVKAVVEKISGDAVTVSVDINTGDISVNLQTWSEVAYFGIVPFV